MIKKKPKVRTEWRKCGICGYVIFRDVYHGDTPGSWWHYEALGMDFKHRPVPSRGFGAWLWQVLKDHPRKPALISGGSKDRCQDRRNQETDSEQSKAEKVKKPWPWWAKVILWLLICGFIRLIMIGFQGGN